MNFATIQMTTEEAALALLDYESPKTEEDVMMAKAYRALRAGKRVLNLYESFKLAGTTPDGLPRLAVAPARATSIYFSFRGQQWQSVYFTMDSWTDDPGRNRGIQIPTSCVPGVKAHEKRLRAVVPTIPPKYRPSDLYPFSILWDAKWEVERTPRDPLLLKKLGGPLYLIVAAWDLTPLERSLLKAGRRS